ncbi:MAG TPA: aldehyde dehydrogenase family protein [Verrucomicrobiae bacterium]|nr:aldehyde dehydrogenase family protein [Verrucomicrobiae bacterium]
MNASRLDVRKTYKLYIGGNFVRSESGRSLAAKSADGKFLDNFGHASRKDLRDAVAAARPAAEGWAKKSAYLRGQILYRAAEMLNDRSWSMTEEIARCTDTDAAVAREEVDLAIDTLVYYAGWTDKYTQVFGAVNPVATSHFNFTTPEPTGVVAMLAPDEPSLVPLVAMAAAAVVSGNSVVVIASEKFPLPALTFGEILATSDLPGGVISILAGKRAELLSHIAGHMDINAIVNGAGSPELQGGTAINLKRYAERRFSAEEWLGGAGSDPYCILDTIEFKTAWHPIGL